MGLYSHLADRCIALRLSMGEYSQDTECLITCPMNKILMGGCQNYDPFLGSYFYTSPII